MAQTPSVQYMLAVAPNAFEEINHIIFAPTHRTYLKTPSLYASDGDSLPGGYTPYSPLSDSLDGDRTISDPTFS